MGLNKHAPSCQRPWYVEGGGVVQPLGLYQTEGLRPSFDSQQPMTNEALDRAAGYATCEILNAAGYGLVGVGVTSLALGGAGAIPMTLGALSLLGAGFACQPIPVDQAKPNQGGGCQEMEGGGYGKIQASVNGTWTDMAGNNPQGNFATKIKLVDTSQAVSGKWASQCSFSTVQDGTTVQTQYEYTEFQAADIKWRIDPVEGACAVQPPLPVLPDPAYEEITYTDESTNCTYNLRLLDFVEEFSGGPVNPVWLIKEASENSAKSSNIKSSGGIIGGCNFQPTVYYNPDGPGGGGPPVNPYPYIPGDDPEGTPQWLKTLLAGLTGAATALATDSIIDAIQDAFATTYPQVIYRMVSVCEKDKDGEPISEAIEVPIPALKAPDAQIARLDALVELLQASKNFKQPVCETVKPVLEGQWRTISFRSDSTSPFGKSRLRKRFRYRSVSGIGLGSLVDHWKDFTFESGGVIVAHKGHTWGTPQVWASTELEGKRVIQHAAGEAGFDANQVGEWVISSSSSARYGVPDTMRVDTTGGYYWITARDGSNGKPIVAKQLSP